jgi:hypothetical protein
LNKPPIKKITFAGRAAGYLQNFVKSDMAKEAKLDFVPGDKSATARPEEKHPEAKAPAIPPPSAVVPPPLAQNKMVEQILERQAVFGF